MTLSVADARSRVEDETQWSSQPCLSVDEVDRLVDRALVTDASGLRPGDTGYVDTFTEDSLRRSIALGWRMKAGKAIGHGDVRVGDVQVSGSNVARSCLDMARRYTSAAGVNSVAGYTSIWETT